MNTLLPHIWIVIILLVIGVVISTASCLRPKWFSKSIVEGFEWKRNWDKNKQYNSHSERLRDIKNLHLNWDMHNQYETVQKQLERGEDVSESAIFDLLKARRELEHYNKGYEIDFYDRIRQKIARGEYISEEELDELKNRKGISSSPYWNRPIVNKYLDDYSIDDYNRRMSIVMPLHFSRGSSRHINIPTRSDIKRGAILDEAFIDSFRNSESELLGDTHLSSHTSSNSYMLLDDDTKPFENNSLAKLALNLPPHNDPYALEGISRSQIPFGEEDKYILKSKIVPPVCPACPNVCPKEKGECPPCPPCKRCPDPDVECRKVTRYTKNKNMPMPILNDFSEFDV
jgi:hypothetical protein